MLILQDPTNDASTTLLESVSNALKSAKSLSGMFSFASKSGVDLLAKDENFRKVAETGAINLVIGIDAVTNAKAIDSLVDLNRQFPKINIRAFMNPKPSGLFHPKFAFTHGAAGGIQITGSGNLTQGGLMGHWEAFSVEVLDRAGIAQTESTFNDWTAQHSKSLLAIGDSKVRERAAKNTVTAVVGDLPTLVARPKIEELGEAEIEQVIPNDARVLVAQIPKSGDRWKQANFDLDNFTNFFGVGDDAAERLWVFRHVNDNGTEAEHEPPRPPVPVVSDNFRFELKAAEGLPYPDPFREGRPIGVFVRIAARLYLYRLVMPDDNQYETVLNLLTMKAGPNHRADRMMRERMTVGELKSLWPASPLWKLPSID
jgi:hypothetical protein